MQEVVCCLVRVKTPQGTSSYLIPKSEFYIGRSQETDLPFPDPSLSRQHLKVVVASDRILITDLGSANGSKLGNQILTPQDPILVRPQDAVHLGYAEVIFFFELIQMPIQLLPNEQQEQQMRQHWQVLWDQLESQRQELIHQTRTQAIGDWNREYEELKAQARAEVGNIKQKAQSQAELMLQKTQSEIERQRTLAQEEIQELKNRFDHWKLENETATLRTLSEKKVESEKQGEMWRQQAQEEARSILSKAHLKADAELREAQARAQELRTQAESEAERRGREVQEQLQRTETESRRSSDQMVLDAREFSERLQSEAREFAEKIQVETREIREKKMAETEMQVQKILIESRALAQRELDNVRREAEQILKSRSEEGQGVLQRANQEVALLMEKESQRVETWSREQRQQTERELQILREEGLQRIRRETEEQQLVVLRKFDEQTRDARLRAEKQLSETEKIAEELRMLQTRREALKTDVADQESLQKRLSSELNLLRKEKEEAEALVSQRDQLKKDSEAFELLLREHREALAKVQDEAREMKAGVTKEAHNLKDQLIIEHEGLKKRLAEESRRAQLKAFEELKERLDLEEKKLREIRKAQAFQMARNIELNLVAAGLKVPEGLVPQAVGAILGESEKLLKLETQHLIESPEQGQKQRQKRFQQGLVASLVFLSGLGIWQRRELQDFLSHGGFASYAQKMIEQRKLASIYRPPQDSRYRDNYTDNVLFLEGYVEVKTDPDYTRDWTMTLNDLELIRSMGLTEEDMVQVVTKEFNLVQRLRDLREAIDAHYLEEGLKKMREAEAETRKELGTVLRTTQNYERLRRLERISWDEFRKRRSPAPGSNASEPEPASAHRESK